MVDTLKLNLIDCEISSHTPLTVEPSPYLHDTQQRFIDYDLFVDKSGEIVQGKKAYYNSDKFNITIKPKYSLQQDEVEKTLLFDKKIVAGLQVSQMQKIKIPEEKFNAGIFVQTSLPRYLNTNNFSSLNASEEKKVLHQLEKDLSGIGIRCNIWDSYLSRVDSFTNIYTDENFYSYSNLFNVLEAARMEKFEYSKTTFLYKNNERQICIYDKISEMKNKVKDSTVYGFLPANVMRMETRYLKKRKVQSALSFVKLGDLYKHYDYLKENHRNEIETNIFKYDLSDIDVMTGNFIKEDMELYYNSGSRLWFNNYLKICGVASLLKLSNIETIIEKVYEIIDADESKSYKNKYMIKSRIKNMMNELRFKREASKLNFASTKTNKELYEELKTKFRKIAA